MTYNLSTAWMVALTIGVIWELAWKAAAMWRAARLDQPIWFTSLLVINSVGVVPIIYLLSHHEYGSNPITYRGGAV